MIRYNANSPEILGKTQFNVMSAIGIWCALLSIKDMLYIFPNITSIYEQMSFPINSVEKVCDWLSPLSEIFNLVLVATLAIGILFRISKALQHIIFLAKFGFILYVAKLLFYFLNQDYDLGIQSNYRHLMTIIQTGLILYILYAIKKLGEHDCIKNYFASKTKNAMPDLDLNSTVESPDNDFRIVTLFKDWDPLYAFGTIMIVLGATEIIGASCILFFQPDIYNMTLRDKIMHVYAFIGMGAIFLLCGYGLRRHSEWGRVFTMLIYLVGFLVVCVFFAMTLELWLRDLPDHWILLLARLSVNFLVSVYWYYLVFFTLWSPIVKYVCIRNGHDIE